MSPTLDSTLADPQQIIADLQRELAQALAERDEALAQQTATAEVLGVINSSPGDLAPVFDAMLERAMRLCEAAFGVLWMFDGERADPAAWRGVPEGFAEFLAATARVPGPGTAGYRFSKGGERSVIQNLNMADEEPYRAGEPLRRALVEAFGAVRVDSALIEMLVSGVNNVGYPCA